jgi:hypothetical protein
MIQLLIKFNLFFLLFKTQIMMKNMHEDQFYNIKTQDIQNINHKQL